MKKRFNNVCLFISGGRGFVSGTSVSSVVAYFLFPILPVASVLHYSPQVWRAADVSSWVQVCNHMGLKADPDQRDREVVEWDVEMVKRFVARILPGLVPEPAVVETCMYTVCIASISKPTHLRFFCSLEHSANENDANLS